MLLLLLLLLLPVLAVVMVEASRDVVVGGGVVVVVVVVVRVKSRSDIDLCRTSKNCNIISNPSSRSDARRRKKGHLIRNASLYRNCNC